MTIHTENLTKIFGKVCAVNRLNLNVSEGAIYALVGPNGAGKTTLIKILMNIMEPTKGKAEVLGLDSTRLTGHVFTNIGYVSENQSFPESMRVEEFFGYLRPFYPAWDRDLEKKLVQRFGLPSKVKLKNLSRGARMKVALASSMAYRPKLLVLDEPFSGLDPLVRDELGAAISEPDLHATVLISSHDLAEVEAFASHIGYLEQGNLAVSEKMSTLLERFREVDVTFGTTPVIPERWPQAWLGKLKPAKELKFVDTRFDEERSTAEILKLFSDVRDIKFTRMSLRSIFVAMAKAGRITN